MTKGKGLATWRCKECHGWDYTGREGRYSKGSHYTGIEGILDEKNESPEEIYEALTDDSDNHDFSAHLPSSDLWALVKFIREGLIDPATAINADGTAKGSALRGGKLYESNCASCHGADGDTLDFKAEKEGVQGVGWLARNNPQESLHKIRWGHPGSDMPSMTVDRKMSDSGTVDILSYSQTLQKP